MIDGILISKGKVMRIIAACRHNDQNNLGDRVTSPANYTNYFPWLKDVERVDLWETDVRQVLSFADSAFVIVGGLGAFGWGTGLDSDKGTRTISFDSNIKALADLELPNVVFWGVGHQSRILSPIIPYPKYLEKFRLVGIRDYLHGTNAPFPPNYAWAACPSCLHPVFDDLSLYQQKTHEVVIYDHLAHRTDIDDPSIPRMSNDGVKVEGSSSLEKNESDAEKMKEVAAFLGFAETVITTSYHGALWATFLGAKVIVPRPWASKFFLYKHQPMLVEDANSWKEARKQASIFPESLTECRESTRRFGDRVFDFYSNLKSLERGSI
jgi:hypothetical protein